MSTGFVLSSSQRDTAEGVELCFWLVTDGPAQKVLVAGQETVFFVLEQQRSEIEFALRGEIGWRLQTLALKDTSQRPVLGLYCRSFALMRSVIAKLERANLSMMEEDIRPADRKSVV